MTFDRPFNVPAISSLGLFLTMIMGLGFTASPTIPIGTLSHDEATDTTIDDAPEGIIYRPGSKILADVLRSVPVGDIASDSLLNIIRTELDSTGRSMPDMWEDALTHRIGVQASKTDIASSVLWVARCLVTESNRPAEFEKIAWVIRNRVDNRFQGETYYRTVILDRAQFSHFNSAAGRAEMEEVGYHSNRPNFQAALKVAYKVITADVSERPFSRSTMFYYSSVSMSPRYTTYCHRRHSAADHARIGRAHPKWADSGRVTATGPDPERFRFMASR